MANIVDTLQNIEKELFNLNKSAFQGKRNRRRDQRINELVKQRSDIYRAMYPGKHKR